MNNKIKDEIWKLNNNLENNKNITNIESNNNSNEQKEDNASNK